MLVDGDEHGPQRLYCHQQVVDHKKWLHAVMIGHGHNQRHSIKTPQGMIGHNHHSFVVRVGELPMDSQVDFQVIKDAATEFRAFFPGVYS